MKLVLDIGGNGVQYQLYDQANIFNKEFSTINKDKDFVLKKIAQIANKNFVTEIGIASPCAVNTLTGDLSGASAIKNYHDFNLYFELRKYLKNDNTKIIAINDANAALLGAIGINVESALMMTIGSGIGGAIIINKQLCVGKNGFGGEFGYFPMLKGNEVKIASEVISSNALVAQTHGVCKNAKEVFKEKLFKPLIEEWFFELATFIVGLNYAFDPEVFYLAGGITKDKDFYKQISLALDKVSKMNANCLKKVNLQISHVDNAAIVGMKRVLDKSLQIKF